MNPATDMRRSALESTTEERQTLGQIIKDQAMIEVIVLRQPLAAVAARCGVSTIALRNAMARQSSAKGTPRLYVALHNQAVIDSAIKRAVVSALTGD
jgi:hypothetical protein